METVATVRLEDVVNMELLQTHVAEGRVSITRHPTLPLRIYNYTHLAQNGAQHWGDGTIDWCRGLIVDDDDNVIARPFRKFHNFNTASVPETLEANLPKTTPTILEKLDGSLGILWRYDGHWGIATRGSFTSPQAIWATEFVKKGIDGGWMNLDFPQNVTPLFEIIYKENRIVIKYDVEGVVLLSLVVNHSGHEANYHLVKNIGERRGFDVVKRHENIDISHCLLENEKNREGYVVSYSMGLDKPPVKVKIKFEDYVRLHKIVTGMNPRSVWEILSSGKDLADLEALALPDHFKDWLFNWTDKLNNEFNAIYDAARFIYVDRPISHGGDQRRYRAEFAAYLKDFKPNLHSVLFSMLDGIDPTPIIWKQLKPRGDDKSFRTDGE